MQFIVTWPAPERHLAKVIDLSPTGMQFVSRQLLRPNQRLKIESPTLSAIAVVSRCAASTHPSIYQTGAKVLHPQFAQKQRNIFSETA
jgi:hypothetical protein